MPRPKTWNISRKDLKKLCEENTLERVAEITGFSKSWVCEKRKEYGLIKTKKGVLS